jgi:hypothetical protein
MRAATRRPSALEIAVPVTVIRKRRPLFTAMICLGLGGCPASKGQEEGKRTAELAEQLVSCQNERSALKEQLAGAQAELARRPQEAPQDRPGDKAETHAGRSARAAGLARRDVTHAAVRRGPENPAEEARAAREVVAILKGHVGQFKPCYERALKRNANLQFVTQVKVQLTATPDGHGKDVRISPRADGEMEACMAQVISRWRFPTFKGQPVVMEVPVNLRVQNP